MKCKGVVNAYEIDDALETAEANALSGPVRLSGLSDANIDAMLLSADKLDYVEIDRKLVECAVRAERGPHQRICERPRGMRPSSRGQPVAAPPLK